MSTNVQVKARPIYGPYSGTSASWFRDQADQFSPNGAIRSAAKRRLSWSAREVMTEAPEHYRQNCNDAGRIADGGMETRVVSSSSAAGFTTPLFLVSNWAAWVAPFRSFANSCDGSVDLPDYGLAVHVPSVASDTPVSAVGENFPIEDDTPSGADLTATVVALSGSVTVSQQLFDRAGTDGLSFDQVLAQQVAQDLDAQVDALAITTALANAGTVTNTATGSGAVDVVTSAYSDIFNASQKAATLSGTRLWPTHVFATSAETAWLLSQVGTNGLPLLHPSASALIASQNDPTFRGYSGVNIGKLALHSDDNIPTTNGGADTQLVVAHPSDILLLEGSTIAFSYPEAAAATLSVLVGFRRYVAVVARHAGATVSVSGARYPVAPTFSQV
jgi:hypothetical protein